MTFLDDLKALSPDFLAPALSELTTKYTAEEAQAERDAVLRWAEHSNSTARMAALKKIGAMYMRPEIRRTLRVAAEEGNVYLMEELLDEGGATSEDARVWCPPRCHSKR